MKNKYDWNALRTEFIKGDMSVAAFAKKCGISYSSVHSHSKSEKWEELRKAFRDKNGDGKESMAGDMLSKEFDIADKLLGVLDEAINDKKQFYRYIVKEKNGSDSGEEERVFEKMDMQAFNNAIKALDSLQEIKRVMYGILSPAEGKGAEGEENETGVVILPEVEEEDEIK